MTIKDTAEVPIDTWSCPKHRKPELIRNYLQKLFMRIYMNVGSYETLIQITNEVDVLDVRINNKNYLHKKLRFGNCKVVAGKN